MSDHRFRVEKGLYTIGASQFENGLVVNSGMTVNNGLLLVNGSFTVTGNYIVQGTVIQDSDVVPAVDGQRTIGSTAYTYNFAANNIYVKSTGQIVPASNTQLLGNTIGRWQVYSNNINGTGSIVTQGDFSVNTAGTPAFTVDSTNLRTAVNTVSTSGYALAVGGNVSVVQAVSANGVSVGAAGSSNSVSVNTSVVAVGNSSVNTQVAPAAIILGKTAFYQNTATVTTTSQTTIDAFPVSLSRAAKLLIAVDGSPYMHAVELLLVTDGSTNVVTSKYGEIYNNSRLGSFDVNIVGGSVLVQFTAAAASTYTVKTSRQQILV
jgi:hypothetical protein